MSALTVELEAGPLEKASADVAVVTLFATDRPLRGAAGRADWRLCGLLSDLVSDGRVRGTAGEALLVPTCGGLTAPLLVVLGLGPREPLDSHRYRAIARDAVRRAVGLGAGAIALPLPEGEAGDFGLAPRAEALVAGAGDALAQREADVLLQLVVARGDARLLADVLRSARPRNFPAGVELRFRAAGGRRPAPPPTGSKDSASESPTPVK